MAYFPRRMDSIERGGKVVADIFCVLLLGAIAAACAGILLGVGATVLVVLGLLLIDEAAMRKIRSIILNYPFCETFLHLVFK